jgi:hypothetical protein
MEIYTTGNKTKQTMRLYNYLFINPATFSVQIKVSERMWALQVLSTTSHWIKLAHK